ncbi:MAG: class III signal peptide-containing protein [Candidatus Micrarchaeota archaeon]
MRRKRGPLGVLEESRGQVSAELLIVIAAAVALAIVLVNQLQQTAKTGAANLEKKTKAAWNEVDKIK